MNADTRQDLDLIEALDWAPPCESTDGCDAEAEWALLISPTPCGCKPLRTVFRCDPCYQRFLGARALFCTLCGFVRAADGVVLNAIRLGGGR